MSDSFSLVENKIQETEYFLDRLQESKRLSFDASCFFSAFVSASRSVTFSVQAVMEGVDGFEGWYEVARRALKSDPLASYFVEVRNDVVHKGMNPLNKVTLDHLRESLSRQLRFNDDSHVLVIPDASRQEGTALADALPVCRAYFISLLSLIYECYLEFRTVVDPRWYFTKENFVDVGKTLDDALVELGFPSSWLSNTIPESEAWKVLRRQQPPCALNSVFHEYLGKVIADPDEAEH